MRRIESFEMQADHLIRDNRPDFMVINQKKKKKKRKRKKKRTCRYVDFAVSADQSENQRMRKKETGT